MSDYVHTAAAEMTARFGIQTSVNRFDHIVVRESDFETLKRIAGAQPPPHPLLRQPACLWAIPIETAPDWTFNPLDIALARLAALLIRALRLRTITRYLNRILSPKETP